MNMQKINVNDEILTKSGQLGKVISIDKKKHTADIKIIDYKDNQPISSVNMTVPLAECKVVKPVQATITETTTKEKMKTMNEMTQMASTDITKVKEIAKIMVELIAKSSSGTAEFLSAFKDFKEKLTNAHEKESKVAIPKTTEDVLIAQVDALTDTNYFVVGSFVELGKAPIGKKSFKKYKQVAEFHEVGGHPVAKQETKLDVKRLVDRSGYTLEELVEYVHAVSGNKKTFDKLVEELSDVMIKESQRVLPLVLREPTKKDIVVYQNLLLNEIHDLVLALFKDINMPSEVFFDIVHEANMTKFYKDENGNYYAKRRESDGKIMKSPDFVAPEPRIKAAIKELLSEDKGEK